MTFNSSCAWVKVTSGMVGALGLSAVLSAPAWSFDTESKRGITLAQVETDTSVESQADSLDIEVPAEEGTPSPDAQSVPQDDGSSTSVSPSELEQFANVVPQLLALEQAGQEQVFQAIDESGLARDRFYEIYQSQVQPSPESPAPEITREEQASFETALGQINAIEQQVQSQQADVIAASGIEPERFNEIMDAVLSDPNLQLEVQELMSQ